MLLQIVQIVSALGIVGAFAALQLHLVGPRDLSYLIANLLSAGGLLVVAVLDSAPGFIITNGFWMVVAAAGLVAVARGRGAVEPS